MSPVLVGVVVLVVAIGVVLATRARRGRTRDRDVLEALGFFAGGARADAPTQLAADWKGREIVATPDDDGVRLALALDPAPLPYEVLARALGRGELLAGLYQLRAHASEARLEARLAPHRPARALRQDLDRLIALAADLERLPRAEGMARWFLELATGESRVQALARLIAAFPDEPETLAACLSERDEPRDPRAAALAREHLAGRARRDDI